MNQFEIIHHVTQISTSEVKTYKDAFKWYVDNYNWHDGLNTKVLIEHDPANSEYKFYECDK